MQQFNKLPLAAKIAIPAVAGLLLLVIMYMALSGGPGTVEVYRSSDADMVSAELWKLNQDKVGSAVREIDGNMYHIKVAAADEAAARASINGTGFGGRLNQKSKNSCKEPGAFGNRSQQELFQTCNLQTNIHDYLVGTSGVLQAKVTVVSEDSGDLVGSETMSSVTILLFLDPKGGGVDAGALAAEAANMVPGGSVDHVFIQDASGTTLWNRNKGAANSSSAAAGACAGPADGATVDITTKEQMVADCDESNLRQQIGRIMGSTDHVQVVERVTLSPSAESVSVSEITKGPPTNQSSNSTKSGGTSTASSQKTLAPGKRETSTSTMAGYVTRRSIAVTLDSKYSDAQKEKAVRALLSTYVDARRGDPAPSVQSVRFATPGAQDADTSSPTTSNGDDGTASSGANAGPAANSGASRATAGTDVPVTHATHIPGAVIAAAAAVVVLLLGAIAMLWRRAGRESQRRQLMEQEFMREQAAFERFAQQDPNALARELEELLGTAPGAPR